MFTLITLNTYIEGYNDLMLSANNSYMYVWPLAVYGGHILVPTNGQLPFLIQVWVVNWFKMTQTCNRTHIHVTPLYLWNDPSWHFLCVVRYVIGKCTCIPSWVKFDTTKCRMFILFCYWIPTLYQAFVNVVIA